MPKINFANLVVKFGEKDMLDYPKIISRAFLNDTNVRQLRSGSFFFLDTMIFEAIPGDPMSTVITGRFVKDTFLRRQQIVEGKKLIADFDKMRSSPSSFFALFLADHRLAFVPETEFAPKLDNLQTTLRRFVKTEFKHMIDEEFETLNGTDGQVTKKALYEHHSPPTVTLVPLTSSEAINKFIDRFSKIEKLTIRLIDRNQDVDGGNIFEALVSKAEPMDPKSAKLEIRSSGDGLQPQATKNFVSETTAGGYEDVQILGAQENGARLNGSNDNFQLSVERDLSEATKARAQQLFEEYMSLKQGGSILVAPRDSSTLSPILKDLTDAAE